jgi:hypothetical protein
MHYTLYWQKSFNYFRTFSAALEKQKKRSLPLRERFLFIPWVLLGLPGKADQIQGEGGSGVPEKARHAF